MSLPGLTWSDIEDMPTLRALMARGAVGSLTAKAAGEGTACLAGALTLSAGNRAEPTGSACTAPPPGPGWAALRSVNLHSEYAADIGALGSALQRAGVGSRATSLAARPLLAGRDGVVGPAQGSSGRQVGAVLDTALYRVTPGAATAVRREADGLADRALRAALAGFPAGGTVIVTATSDAAGGGPTLHPLVIAGPGWPHRELTFAGSRPPYTELIDLAPTILTAVGVAVPDSMVGKPLQVTHSSVRSPAAYLDGVRHAQADASVQAAFLLALGWLTILLILLATLGRGEARTLARLLAPAPLMSFLVNLLPWWRWERWVYALVLAAGCALVAGATTLFARRRPLVAVLAVPALSLAVLVADQLAGAPMQLASPLGYGPIDAGRFIGIGNLDFAVLGASALVVAALAGAWLAGRAGVMLAAAVLLVAVVVDAAPPLGDDAGGVLALVPAAAVVVAVLAGFRLSVRRLTVVVAGTAALAVAIALGDYSRPESSQTHIGRFVGQLLHGGAGTEVGRKAHAALATVGLTISTAVVVVAIAGYVVRRARIRAAVDIDTGLLALLVGGVTLAAIGSALNDSGLTVAALVLTVGCSAVLSVQWPIRIPTRHEASSNATTAATTTRTPAADSPDRPGR